MARRFLFYLIGVGLGVIASMLFFGDRDIEFAYLPNARTLKHLRTQELTYSDQALCELNCLGMTKSSFEKVFFDGDLDVDFSASDVKGHCRTYLIEVENQSFERFNIDDCDSVSTILSIPLTNCPCN